jgi:hypothetical protein
MRSKALLLFLALFTQALFAAEIPVEINLPDETLRSLSPDERVTLNGLKLMFEKNIWKWDDLRFELPETVFSDNEVIVRLDDLFKRPSADEELRELATDPDGKPLKLDPSQIESIRDTALLVIPSKKYPGQNHVWKVALWIQKGRNNIEISLNQDKAAALRELIVKIPNRWKKGTVISVRDGLVNIESWLRGSLSLIIGLVEKKPRYSDVQVETTIKELAEQNALQGAGVEADADDLSRNPKIVEKAIPILKEIVRRLDTEWPAIQQSAIPNLIAGLNSETPLEERQKIISENLEKLRIETFYSKVEQDPKLNELKPGLGHLFIRRDEANRVALQVEADFARDYDAKKSELTAALQAQNPVRGKIEEWVAPQVEAQLRAYVAEQRPIRNEKLLEALKGEGLTEEANLLERSLNFYMKEANRLRKNMSSEQIASRPLTLRNRIWFAKNWIVVKSVDQNGETKHSAQKSTVTTISTATPLWRLELAGARMWSLLKNLNYFMVVENLIDGPVGVKSLFYQQNFTPSKKVNEKTGELETDRSWEVSTLRSRQKTLSEWKKKENERFENSPNNGFKDALRPLVRTLNWTKTAVASTVLWAAQPTLTGVNALLSGTMVATSPLLAMAVGVSRWAFDASIYDSARPTPGDPKWLPLADRLLCNGGVGVCQFMGGIAGTVVVHPAVAGYQYLGGEFAATADIIWDSFMASLFLRKFKVPSSDGFGVRRTKGPGLAADYYYQIQPTLALVALQSKLELFEMQQYIVAQKALISEPGQNAEKFIERTVGPLGLELGNAEWTKEMGEQATELSKKLDELTTERFKILPRLSDRGTTPAIRMTAADLEATLQRAVPLVQRYWEERVRRLTTPDEENAFWNKESLAKDDFSGLTRIFLARTFGAGFLQPLEEANSGFTIQVATPNYGAVVDSVITGTGVNPGQVHGGDVVLPVEQALGNYNPTLGSASVLVNTVTPDPCEVVLRGVSGHRAPLRH